MIDISATNYSKCDRCREGKIENPTNLCFYHAKVEKGLIDEPIDEIPYTEIWVEDEEKLGIFMDQVSYLSRGDSDVEMALGMQYRKVIATWDSKESSFKTWCNRVLRNAFIDYKRKDNKDAERHAYLSDLDLTFEANMPNPEELTVLKHESEELRGKLVETLGELSERQQDVLWKRLLTHEPASQQLLADYWGVSQQMIGKDELAIRDKIKGAYNG